MRAFAPTGSPILGTLERLSGRAEITDGSYTKNANGELEFEWQGGTEIFYDDQETVTGQNRERVFLDEDGVEWLESQIVLKDEEALF